MKTFEHGGNIHREKRASGRQLIDFSANINPLGPPDWLRPLISSQIEELEHYPDPESSRFVAAIASHSGLSPAAIVVSNGTSELLHTLMRLLPCQRVVLPVPAYVDYQRAAQLAGRTVELLPLSEAQGFRLDFDELAERLRPGDLAVVATPNNPTGLMPDRQALLALIRARPECTFLLDEAFVDFLADTPSLAGLADNLLTLNSMTKFYALPGLRLGYGSFPPALAETLREHLPPWSVNTLAQVVGERALADHRYQERSRSTTANLRQLLSAELCQFGQLQVFPGEANYLLIKIVTGGDSHALSRFCLERGVMIRRCDNYPGLGCGAYFRLAVRREEENEHLLEVLRSFFPGSRSRPAPPRRAAALMFQGTCSDAGKSIVSAAFCRIFRQDGLRVAPFKAQNMSLNSFVTHQGDEMGRAQVVQAQAAGIDPDSRMNPILLKPNSDTGSQVIVRGRPVGNMAVSAYNNYKSTVWPIVCDSYESLAAEYQVVVLEGAGSPGEVNLKADDLVNMKMARHARAPVILVGDIDRGGVYASFVGIMEVLAGWERRLVQGFLVNKFRGQSDLLASAHDYVREHTGREVLGVIPYLRDLGLPEEDSVAFKKGSFNRQRLGEGVDIVVIDLPHIANFTDLEPFLAEPDVGLRVIERPADIGRPAAILLPGSKNVLADLVFLRSQGFARAISEAVAAGCELVGICGGYQMLGTTIADPYQIESSAGSVAGLAYLPMETVIERDKNLLRKSGVHSPSGEKVVGYEIHHGLSTAGSEPLFRFDDGSGCGHATTGGQVWGSYLHGMFDSDDFRRWFIDRLRQRCGLPPVGRVLAPYSLDLAFDRLAAAVRESVDMEQVYHLLRL